MCQQLIGYLKHVKNYDRNFSRVVVRFFKWWESLLRHASLYKKYVRFFEKDFLNA